MSGDRSTDDDLDPNYKSEETSYASSQFRFSRLRVPMGKYCYGKGRRKIIDAFTNRQGLWILAVVAALSMGTVVLYLIGYLHFNGD